MEKSQNEYTTNILNKVFTPGQVKILISPNTNRIRWTIEDITAAIALRSISTKAYNYLRYE